MQKKPQWAETPNRHLRSAQNGQQSSFFAGAGQRNQSSIARLVGCNGGDDVRDRSLGKGGGLRAGAASRFGPAAKKILKNLRYLWIALANECDVMSADEFARESEVIGRLHVELALLDRPSLH